VSELFYLKIIVSFIKFILRTPLSVDVLRFINTSMSSAGVTQLLFTTRNDVSVVDVADWRTALASNVTSSPRSIVSGLEDAIAVDYVWSDSSIYWTDLTHGRVYRTTVNLSTSSRPGRGDVTVVAGGIEAPDGLACDWVGRKLYWADSETDRIEVAQLDGTMRRVLYWQDIDQPRAIALDPTHGYFTRADLTNTFPPSEMSAMSSV